MLLRGLILIIMEVDDLDEVNEIFSEIIRPEKFLAEMSDEDFTDFINNADSIEALDVLLPKLEMLEMYERCNEVVMLINSKF